MSPLRASRPSPGSALTHQAMPSRARARHRAKVALPVAVIGSLAVSLIPTPAAHAAPSSAPRDTAKPVQPTTRLPAASSAAVPLHYTVAPGDTVSGIAERFGLATAAVLALNGLSWRSLIFPGQVLELVPAAPRAEPPNTIFRYTITAGDTISEVAEAHGLRTAEVLAANGLEAASIIYPGQVIVLPHLEATTVSAASLTAIVPLDAEMRRNAETIIAVARMVGVDERGILVALVAAAQESRLRNLDYGDRDSLGLFQQRPSTGWGRPADVLDPAKATRSFFLGTAHAPGLLDIDGWETLGLSEAAQAVQVSAHPDAYHRWETSAQAWLAELA